MDQHSRQDTLNFAVLTHNIYQDATVWLHNMQKSFVQGLRASDFLALTSGVLECLCWHLYCSTALASKFAERLCRQIMFAAIQGRVTDRLYKRVGAQAFCSSDGSPCVQTWLQNAKGLCRKVSLRLILSRHEIESCRIYSLNEHIQRFKRALMEFTNISLDSIATAQWPSNIPWQTVSTVYKILKIFMKLIH